MKPIPILLVGDNPAGLGGLARIGRDLATLLATIPEFSVGYLGRGEGNRRKLPFTLYAYPESGNWGQGYLAQAWHDFSDGRSGVILTTDDPTRRVWFAAEGAAPNPEMAKFLGSGRNFRKWAYMPIDGSGPNGMALPGEAAASVAGYDRVLTASEWSCTVLKATGRHDADWLPHGIWFDKFRPIADARALLGWKDTDIIAGANMANQSRKDFPALFEAFAVLKQQYGNRLRAWLHTDILIRYWNVFALAHDYGLTDCLEVSIEQTDEQLAMRYSACDVTLLPSAAEGFGYPIAESLACGTPCVVTDYAAGQELVEEDCRVSPVAWRIDTQYNMRRAVLSGHAFGKKAIPLIEKKHADWDYESDLLRETVAHLNWDKLRFLWEKWFREGLR